ncbi:MAG TPA: carbohydrate-binding protein [Acetivibrio sp.]|uniref:carbohydrate-binding protein n=1 Tax=Acetivibrio sp. TaxID=1872092 RepID=UPI002BF9F28C|nr:carbohydrate-binding protein [Acetivibrio sp.]HOM01987.1 carbohydrate-binding protein [Acetivibrio sp.]
MAKTKQVYADNGVEISKTSLGVGDEVTLYYKGLLAQSGADAIFAHIGYGENWEDKTFIPMERENDVFKATIKIDHADDLNIAFKDSGDNWDNNSWANYSFKVSKKAKPAKIVSNEEKTEKKTSAKSAKSSTAKSAASKKSTATKSASTKKTASGKSKKTSVEK